MGDFRPGSPPAIALGPRSHWERLSDFKLFDSHLHIINKKFPLIENNGYTPDSFLCADYLQRMKSYQLIGGTVVSGSFQGFDQNYLIDALKTLGSGFVGIFLFIPLTISPFGSYMGNLQSSAL